MENLIRKAEDLLIEVNRQLEDETDQGTIELLDDFADDLRLFIKHAKNEPDNFF